MKALKTAVCLAAVLAYACLLPLWANGRTAPALEVSAQPYKIAASPAEALLALASDPNVSEAQRVEAQRRLEESVDMRDYETAIEQALLAIGCEGCSVQLSAAYACVFAPEKTANERATAILAVVSEISGLDPGRVRIVPR